MQTHTFINIIKKKKEPRYEFVSRTKYSANVHSLAITVS